MDSVRANFENVVPCRPGVIWDEHLCEYRGESEEWADEADEYQSMFEGWRLCSSSQPTARVPDGFSRMAYNRKTGEWLYINHAGDWQLCPCPVQPSAQVPEGWQAIAEQLFILGKEFWHSEKPAGSGDAVQWVRNDETGEMFAYTRGEYAAELAAFIGALSAAPSIAEKRQEVERYEIGIYGKAYDGPGEHRAYTYQHQPDNLAASKLGEAARAERSGGDHIDYGLALLRQLQDAGFGVFEIVSPPSIPGKDQ